MKTYRNLFEKVINKDNIKRAIYRSAKRKSRRKDVQEVITNIDKHVDIVIALLVNKQYSPSVKQAKLVQEGASKKTRLIVQPSYKYDQIIHHAVVQVLQPIFMKGMYEYCCGSVPKRGSIKAKKYIERFIRKRKVGIKYFLKLDIRKYFQSVDTNVVERKLSKIIKDENMMWLLKIILSDNKAVLDGEEINLGLPIGYYTSQWFANWLLQDLDHKIKEKLGVKGYVRYIDDMVMFGRNKKKLHRILKIVAEDLSDMCLNVKDNWQVSRFDYVDRAGNIRGRDLDYLGFRFFRNRTTLRRSIMLKATRKARRIHRKKLTWYTACQMISLAGWFKHTNTYNVYSKYISNVVSIRECRKTLSKHQLSQNIIDIA